MATWSKCGALAISWAPMPLASSRMVGASAKPRGPGVPSDAIKSLFSSQRTRPRLPSRAARQSWPASAGPLLKEVLSSTKPGFSERAISTLLPSL